MFVVQLSSDFHFLSDLEAIMCMKLHNVTPFVSIEMFIVQSEAEILITKITSI